MTLEHRGANTNCDSQTNDAQNSSHERLPEQQQVPWTPQNKITPNSTKCSCHTWDWWDITRQCQCLLQWWSTAVTAVPHRVGAVSILRTSHRSWPLHFSHPTKAELALVRNLYFSPTKYWENNKWIDTLPKSGCSLPNQQVSASETPISKHLSLLLIGRTLCHVSIAQVNTLPWWVGLVVAWQHTL